MPNASQFRKRVALSLSPEEYELVTRLAKAQKKSRAWVFESLFHEMQPVLERLVVVMEGALQAQETVKGSVRKAAEKTEAVLESHARAALDQVDWLIGSLSHDSRKSPPAAGFKRSTRRGSSRTSQRAVRAQKKRKRAR